jgi:prolipoprotein diacylglyceryltransferase
MNIDLSEIYRGVNLGMSFTGGLIKVLVGLMLFAVVFYSFMFILKFRILQDTIDISSTNISKILIIANLVISLVGSVLAFILILL